MSITDFAAEYEKSTENFLALVETLEESDLDRRDSEGWSPRQVIHHLADSEAQSYARLRRLIAEPGTEIQGYDESKWAENPTLGYADSEISTALNVFKAVRRASLHLIVRLSEEQLDNSGIHSESGEYSVRKWLETYSSHPTDHGNQIRSQIS